MSYLFTLILILVIPLCTFASTGSDACKTKENLRKKMNIIASNLANIDTTRTPDGGPFRRKEFVCNEKKCEVKEALKIVSKYEPGHPDANDEGYVSYPDIDVMHEMNSMIQASRDFEDAAKICK